MNGLNQLIAQGVQFKAPPDPFEQYGRMQQLEQGQQANLLNQMKMQEYQRGVEEQNRLRQLDPAATDYIAQVSRVNPKTGFEFEKLKQDSETAKLANRKTQIEVAAARKKLEQQAKRDISQNPSDAQVTAYIEDMQNSGLYSDAEKSDSQAELKQLLAIPYEERKVLFASQGATAGELKPTTTWVDQGGTKSAMQSSAFGGAPKQVGSLNVSVDPNTLANNATSRSNNAASIAAQATQGNLNRTNAVTVAEKRASDTNKPLPVGALKMRVEAQDAADTAEGINERISISEKKISEGKLSFGPVSNLLNTGLNAAGMSTDRSRNLADFKSDLEKLRNDSLRLNKGVQTEGDAQRAWNEILQNINDTELVKQRLSEIKKINARAKNLRLMEVDTIDRNYGRTGNTAPANRSVLDEADAILNGG